MAPVSDPRFLTHHALRIKGFAHVAAVAEVSDQPEPLVEQHLNVMQSDGFATYRDLKSLWQITPAGREAHRGLLERDVAEVRVSDLAVDYAQFLALNETLKRLCTDWQMRDGRPNDHADAAYDAAVVDRLTSLHVAAMPLVDAMAQVVGRLRPYGRRLDAAEAAVRAGDISKFTGVMCGSYHDVWMELHEDLILTQGIDRSREGSF